MDYGFRFALMLEDGDPADPAAFVTAVPNWRVGDEFMCGPELREFQRGWWHRSRKASVLCPEGFGCRRDEPAGDTSGHLERGVPLPQARHRLKRRRRSTSCRAKSPLPSSSIRRSRREQA
jgi:hypothetical protein